MQTCGDELMKLLYSNVEIKSNLLSIKSANIFLKSLLGDGIHTSEMQYRVDHLIPRLSVWALIIAWELLVNSMIDLRQLHQIYFLQVIAISF